MAAHCRVMVVLPHFNSRQSLVAINLFHWKTFYFCLPKMIFTPSYGPGAGIKARRKPKDIYPWWAFFFSAELSLLPVLTSNSFWKLRRHCVLKCILFRHLMDYILHTYFRTDKGAFTNYVYKICLFLTTYPPPFTFSMVSKFTKSQFFWPTTPLLL